VKFAEEHPREVAAGVMVHRCSERLWTAETLKLADCSAESAGIGQILDNEVAGGLDVRRYGGHGGEHGSHHLLRDVKDLGSREVNRKQTGVGVEEMANVGQRGGPQRLQKRSWDGVGVRVNHDEREKGAARGR
jgi:hypothetical protein